MAKRNLIDMMFASRPIEEFRELLESGNTELDWGQLLHMCYMEESYERVGGDLGYKENPPINHERIAYLTADNRYEFGIILGHNGQLYRYETPAEPYQQRSFCNNQ